MHGAAQPSAGHGYRAEAACTAETGAYQFPYHRQRSCAGGAKTKFKANIEAIRLLQTLDAEQRQATAEEQEVLSRYVAGAVFRRHLMRRMRIGQRSMRN